MEEINYDQENDNEKLNLVEIEKEKKPAITGPVKVLFLDDCKPFSPFPSSIHLFAKLFVANKMQAPFYTMIDLDGTSTECIGSGGAYAAYFSIPLCISYNIFKPISNSLCDSLSKRSQFCV